MGRDGKKLFLKTGDVRSTTYTSFFKRLDQLMDVAGDKYFTEDTLKYLAFDELDDDFDTDTELLQKNSPTIS